MHSLDSIRPAPFSRICFCSQNCLYPKLFSAQAVNSPLFPGFPCFQTRSLVKHWFACLTVVFAVVVYFVVDCVEFVAVVSVYSRLPTVFDGLFGGLLSDSRDVWTLVFGLDCSFAWFVPVYELVLVLVSDLKQATR